MQNQRRFMPLEDYYTFNYIEYQESRSDSNNQSVIRREIYRV